MTIEYNIIKDDDDYVAAWDKFSMTVSDAYDWSKDDPLSVYKAYFEQHMIKEGMIPNSSEEAVTFIDEKSLTMFLLKWS